MNTSTKPKPWQSIMTFKNFLKGIPCLAILCVLNTISMYNFQVWRVTFHMTNLHTFVILSASKTLWNILNTEMCVILYFFFFYLMFTTVHLWRQHAQILLYVPVHTITIKKSLIFKVTWSERMGEVVLTPQGQGHICFFLLQSWTL